MPLLQFSALEIESKHVSGITFVKILRPLGIPKGMRHGFACRITFINAHHASAFGSEELILHTGDNGLKVSALVTIPAASGRVGESTQPNLSLFSSLLRFDVISSSIQALKSSSPLTTLCLSTKGFDQRLKWFPLSTLN